MNAQHPYDHNPSGQVSLNLSDVNFGYDRTPDFDPDALPWRPDFALLWAAVRRRLGLILIVTVLVTLFASWFILRLRSHYQAEATLLWSPPWSETRSVNLGSSDAAIPVVMDSSLVRSEIAMLNSDDLARQVIAQLNLAALPEFSFGPRLFSRFYPPIRETVARIAADLGLPKEDEPPAPLEAPASVALAIYKSALTVSNDGRSYMLRVAFQADSPDLASRIVTRHVAAYLENQEQVRNAGLIATHNWLDHQVAVFAERLHHAEDALTAYREKNNLVAQGTTSPLAQRLAEINTQLSVSQAAAIQNEARLNSIKRSSNTGSDISVTGSETISRLREQESVALSRLADVTSRMGSAHPAAAAARQQVADLQQIIGRETQRLLQGVANEAQISRARADELQRSLTRLEAQSAAADRAQNGARPLEREIAATKVLYDSLLESQKRIDAEQHFERPSSRVISQAMPPVSSNGPNRPMLIALTFLGTMFTGMGAVASRELMRSRFTSLAEVGGVPGVQSLGVLPRLSRAERSFHPRRLGDPSGSMPNYIGTLHTALMLARPPGEAIRTIAVTSAMPGDGATTTAIALARGMAEAGLRVLLIDANLHHPTIARTLKLPVGSADLSDVLSERALLLKAQPVPGLTLSVVTVRPNPGLAAITLGAPAMQELLGVALGSFDRVIIDTPSLGEVPDAALVARLTHMTILVVRCESTPRDAVLNAARILRNSLVPSVGVVLNLATNARRMLR